MSPVAAIVSVTVVERAGRRVVAAVTVAHRLIVRLALLGVINAGVISW